MKKTKGIKPWLGLLLVTLLIGACEEQALPPDTGSDVNDTFFWADAGNGKNIIVGIANPASFPGREAFAPVTGFWYAIWLASESDTASAPLSIGTITVLGDQLFFSPFTDMGYSGAVFRGTFSGGKLTMDSIPGTNLVNIALEEGGDFSFDPDNPSGSLPAVPDTGGDGDSKPTNPDAILFKPGRYVTDVAIINRPTATAAYEGFPVDLTGMTVEITYNNGDKVTKTSANANEFLVTPPVYEAAGMSHAIQYIAEYNNILLSPPEKRVFNAPSNNQAQNTSFYDIINTESELTATVTGNIGYFEGDPSFDFTGVSIKAKYSTGERTITPTAVYKTVFTAADSPNDSKLTVFIGRKQANIPIKHDKAYNITGIVIATAPNFSDHILFDDPRFYSIDAEKYWLSRFSGATLKLSYAGTTVKRTISIIRAQAENRLYLVPPVNLTERNPKAKIILYGDDRREFETTQVVPAYNKLVSISIQQLKEGLIILKGSGPLPADNEQSFLKQIKISAVYQLSTDKTKTITRDNILVYPTGSSYNNYVGVDTNLIYALPLETNVTTGEDGILTEANSKSYDTKNKLSKAKITFTTQSVGEDPQPVSKSATIEVGVTGYK